MSYEIKFQAKTQKWRVLLVDDPRFRTSFGQMVYCVKEFVWYVDAKKFLEELEEYDEEEICEECGKRLVEGDDDDDICSAGCPAYDAGWAETHPEEED